MTRRRFNAASEFQTEQQLDSLARALRRLTQHRGYDRSVIVSAVLKRVLAPSGSFPQVPPSVEELRARLDAVCVDRKMLDYLLHNLAAEMDVAHRRSVEGV
ncbi:hypothetical protein [Methylobacterium nodulans]|uniref:Uncharacterized protein n=1 Tax=Methylobacterium nodulans (strain LMG 21967 / CNCM I-2342 / ORS 2060) TaxID=460265 RepID=B8ID37_METNO|nr:hypothetical protein [Methylobacterium nodulans]ACL59429.1 conserved hypothetical protein [Methylobacterium nodulans ORS 2060]